MRERNRLSTGESHRCKFDLRRMIVALGLPVRCGDIALHAFPSAESLRVAGDDILLATGLSANKLATLRRVADALLSSSLDEAMLEERPSPDAVEILCRIKGIGPWTATVILLRGLGRLDVFPMNDSSVARNLAFVAGASPLDIGPGSHCTRSTTWNALLPPATRATRCTRRDRPCLFYIALRLPCWHQLTTSRAPFFLDHGLLFAISLRAEPLCIAK